jgi:serine/threonine protein kinase
VKKPTPFGKYYLLERINVGGMAEVFRAKAFGVEGFERLVAVKRILPNIAEDKEFIRMFIDEAKLSVQLNHANIAQIFDLGNHEGAYFIALEHVHGRDLRSVFDRCRQLGESMPVAQACFVVMKVCEGLDYAHNKRDQAGRDLHLVHRDVSPQNVLVSFEGEVKLIDFGIAKAAGKGSKTQAGILKGKFGYMSPEQVRGIPIDRRSDVFSCGIVLYELLTGERLFVGESDFSTLEKVRNVEILPPSTYNRKIPDELERIVLKALAKDTDDRYANAIDLHDELQAFVYTAGEFYSRKDLAGWMKKQFGKEIEEETAKLETYRQLKAPVEPPPAIGRANTGSRPAITTPASGNPRRTQAQVAIAPPPPRPPATPPPPPRMTGAQAAVQVAPPSLAAGKSGPQLSAKPNGKAKEEGLEWDDDELETQIYDDDGAPKQRKPKGANGANGGVAAQNVDGGPDLSSLVSTGKGWEAPKGLGGAPASASNGHANGTAPPPLANGSAKVRTPSDPRLAATLAAGESFQVPATDPGLLPAQSAFVPSLGSNPRSTDLRESAFSGRLVADEQPYDPMASFGASITHRERGGKRNSVLLLAIGGVAVVAVAITAAMLLSGGSGGGDKKTPVATNPGVASGVGTEAPVAQVAVAPIAVGNPDTGFDLYVTPPGVTQWHLDGEARTDRLPSRIRGIAPGKHTVAIDAPNGYLSASQQVVVEANQAGKVEIVLPKRDVAGSFESTPPGAIVSLIVDGKRQTLGESPATQKLDPTLSYQVLFEKPGYVSLNRTLTFTGGDAEKIVVNLEKVGGAVAIAPLVPPVAHPNPPQGPVTSPRNTPVDNTPKEPKQPKLPVEPKETPKEPKEAPVVADAGGKGTLLIGSKPPCQVFIDGSDQGTTTPHKFADLAAGKHKITLTNNDFGIRESFFVEIKADAVTKEIKDYTSKMKKDDSGGGDAP